MLTKGRQCAFNNQNSISQVKKSYISSCMLDRVVLSQICVSGVNLGVGLGKYRKKVQKGIGGGGVGGEVR